MSASAGSISGPVVGSGRRLAPSPAADRNGTAAPGGAAVPADPNLGVPARAQGIDLLGEVPGSGYRRAPSLVRRADGQTVQLTPILYRLLEAVDGRRSYAELAETLSARIGRLATADDIRFLAEAKLRPLGLLQQPDGTEPKVEKTSPLLGLRLKAVLANPELTRTITAPFALLFTPPVVVAVLVAFTLATCWLAFEKGLASAARQALYEPSLLVLVLALTLLSAAFHEMGHAAACRYGGARTGGMGVGLYLVWPAFYTDVTDSYRLGRGGRLRVDLGGLYFNAIFGVGIVALWAAVGWDALLLVVAAQVLQMARQLLPFVRFDGYHILADLTGVPDLFHHIKPTLLGLLPTRWGRAEGKVLKTWARTVVTLWVLLVIPVLGAILALLVVALPRLLATAWDSLGMHWDALAASWGSADGPALVVGLFSLLTICLPVAGIGYLLGAVSRRTALAVWRATAGRPTLRAGAVLAGAAVLTAVGWAWWPDGQYRPLEAGDRWKVQVPSLEVKGNSAPEPAPLRLAGTAGQGASAQALSKDNGPRASGGWMLVAIPEEMLPTEAANEPAPTQSPPGQDDSATPGSEWIFPFDPPAEPGPGDNQALAVNTQDGSSVTDVALALVWVTDGGPVEQGNEAYALASCADCQAVAVAFQVVLVIGYAQIVTPTNAAVALNYECDSCVTQALAMQLVATLTQPPSDEARSELEAIWAELEEASHAFELLPFAEVYAVLDETRASVLELLAQDGVLAAAGQGPTAAVSDDAAGPAVTTESESEPAGESEPPTDTAPATTTDGTSTTSEPATAEVEPTTTTAAPSEEPTTTTDGSTDGGEPATTTGEGTEDSPQDEPTTTAP